MNTIPDPNVIFPNEYKTSCFIKNVITALSKMSLPPQILRLGITHIMMMQLTQPVLKGTTYSFPIRSLATALLSENFVRLLPVPSLLWVRQITVFAV